MIAAAPAAPCTRCSHPHPYPPGVSCDYAVGGPVGECGCTEYEPEPCCECVDRWRPCSCGCHS